MIEVNGQPGIRINAVLKRKVSERAAIFDCEGDDVMLPLSQVKIEEKYNTIILPTWLYNLKFNIEGHGST